MTWAATVVAIILQIFGAVHGSAAVRVARCESGLRVEAVNGQYRGIFQMGTNERRRYARGRYSTVRDQVLAAWRYWRLAGWEPWACRP